MPTRPENTQIVICGAGIAGAAAAYFLTMRGAKNVTLIEEGNPLSLTSDKSTEAYRNWWPGPDAAMTAYMNHSIDLLEGIAATTGNRINMNRRGYLFASADASKVDWLVEMAKVAERHGAGAVRIHDSFNSTYDPAPDATFGARLSGADVLTDAALIRQHFPFLAPETKVVAHARRAGWLSAQQLGMGMLEAARERGAKLVRGRVTGADVRGGKLRGVQIERDGARETIGETHLVLASGPMTQPLAQAMGLELPIFTERHLKISFSDPLGAIPRSAPMIIWLDAQRLPWSEDERQLLAADDATRWLTEEFPWGAHGRPDGGPNSSTVLALYNYHNEPADVVFPLPESPHYGEIVLRGMATMVPALKAYLDKGVRPYVDGGYYTKTRENRPLVGPTPIEGVYLSTAYSGFGIMASCAGGDLLASHILGGKLPDYASAFALSRYDDPAYVAGLAAFGDGSQL